MPAVITNEPIVDAVENTVLALETQMASWNVGSVFNYPAWNIGKKGNSIAVSVSNYNIQLVGVASPDVIVDHIVNLKIWYFTRAIKSQVAFNDLYSKLSKIMLYILTHPNLNGYGETLLGDNAFGPSTDGITAVESEAGQLLGGAINVVHTLHSSQHTMTFGG